MPKNSTQAIVTRWIALDYWLRWGRVYIDPFARSYRVNPKRVRADLKDFKDLGQEWEDHPPDANADLPPDLLQHYYKYKPGVTPLFTRNTDHRNVPPDPE